MQLLELLCTVTRNLEYIAIPFRIYSIDMIEFSVQISFFVSFSSENKKKLVWVAYKTSAGERETTDWNLGWFCIKCLISVSFSMMIDFHMKTNWYVRGHHGCLQSDAKFWVNIFCIWFFFLFYYIHEKQHKLELIKK